MKKPLILESKLIPPDCSRMLRRVRLLDNFKKSDECLTVICADAGYGKSTLMGQFYEEFEGHGLWYQLDSTDKDMAVFLAHLAEGLSRIAPETGATMERTLLRTKDAAGDWQSIMAAFINELTTVSEKPFIICFDEYRWIDEPGDIIEATQFLINHLPPGIRVVIASRLRLSLALGRLRTQKKLKEIGIEDLRFTIEEIANLFSGCCVEGLSGDELKAWHDATGGWPVAVVLSRNLLDKDHRLPEAVNPLLLGAHGAIEEYLADEIWSGLDSDLQQFMMKTSLLDTVEVDICDQTIMAGSSKSAAAFLKELERRNLMISCLEVGRIYRYLPLFRQFLFNKLELSMSISGIKELSGLYGQAYADHGQYDLAIRYFLESRTPANAAYIIETRCLEILEAGKYDALAKWLSRLSDEEIRARPWLAYCSARITERSGDVEGIRQWYELAEEGFTRDGDSHGLFTCALSMAENFMMCEMNQQGLEKATQSLKWAATREQKVAALSQTATQYLLLGFGNEAQKLLNQAEGICDESDVETGLMLEVRLLVTRFFNGDFSLLHDETVKLQGKSGMRSPIFSRFQMLSLKVLSLYEMARYEEALAAIDERRIYLGVDDQLMRMSFEFLRGVVLLSVEDGRSGQKIIEAIDHEVGGSKNLGPYYTSNYLGAYLRRKGEVEKAIEANTMSLHHLDGGNQYTAASCLVNLGANRLRQKNNDPEGIRDLEKAQALAEEHGYKYLSTQAHFNFAYSALEEGNDERALMEISDALKLASRFQYNNFIIQEGRISTRLLAFAIEHDIEREYLTGILPAIGPFALNDLAPLLKSDSSQTRAAAIVALVAAGGVNAAPYVRRARRDQDVTVQGIANSELRRLRSSIVEPKKILTRRENQVMGLIAEGFSNAEIAERLYISEPTTKAHVSSIFRKLGLTSRSQVAVLFLREKSTSDGD